MELNPGRDYVYAKNLQAEVENPRTGLERMQEVRAEISAMLEAYKTQRFGQAAGVTVDTLTRVGVAATIVINNLHETPYAEPGLKITIGDSKTGEKRGGTVVEVPRPDRTSALAVLRDGTSVSLSWREKDKTYRQVGKRDGYTIGGIAVDYRPK